MIIIKMIIIKKHLLKITFMIFVDEPKNMNLPSQTTPKTTFDTTWNISLDALIPGLWNIIIVMAPFAGCQWYAYTSFCRANIASNNDNMAIFNNDLPEEVVNYGKENDLLMPFININNSVAAEWCEAEPPISYHHVVAKYWKIDVFSPNNLFYSFTNSSSEWPYLFIAAPVYGMM